MRAILVSLLLLLWPAMALADGTWVIKPNEDVHMGASGQIPVAGAWFSSDRPTRVEQDAAGNMVFVNEYGARSAGRYFDANTVVATDWEGGLRGSIVDGGKTIRWANGTAWTRGSSSAQSNKPKPGEGWAPLRVDEYVHMGASGQTPVAGAWFSSGRPTRIEQDAAGNMVFVNEYGARSAGRYFDANTVVATDWEGGLHGSIVDGGNTIRWANGTAWTRIAR